MRIRETHDKAGGALKRESVESDVETQELEPAMDIETHVSEISDMGGGNTPVAEGLCNYSADGELNLSRRSQLEEEANLNEPNRIAEEPFRLGRRRISFRNNKHGMRKHPKATHRPSTARIRLMGIRI